MKRALSFFTIIVLVISLLAACSKPFEKLSSTELLDLGEKYLLEMNYEQAVVYFARVIEIESMNPRGYTGVAEAYVGLGDTDSAIEELLKGIAELPDDSSISGMLKKLIDEQFGIGESLLVSSDFQQAVNHFTKLIGYMPLIARGYTGCAKAFVGQGNIEKAIEILRQGLQLIPGEPTITKMLDDLLYEQERESRALEARPILIEIAELCSGEQYEVIFERMQTSDFSRVTELSKFLNRPYIVDTDFGRIGVYEVNSDKYGNYMVYFGDYVGDSREGTGVWLGYYEGQNYFAKGLWSSDMPNGETQIREWYSMLAEDVTYRIISGNVVEGLWDGDVIWSFERGSEPMHIFPVKFEKGHWVVIEIDDDREDGETEYIVSKSGNTNDDNSGVMSAKNPDELEGIVGYVE
jgi:tetratricopeptide (TPR) repeat protein